MKNCPFCREEIVEDALKCRYCASNLVQIPGPDSDRSTKADTVTYVIDRGLMRFGKFVAASLAFFLVIGAYLFGFKLDDAVEKLRDSQIDIAEAQSELKTAQRELEQAKVTVRQLEGEVRVLLADARAHLGDIQEHRTLAEQMLGAMRIVEAGVTVQLAATPDSSGGNFNAVRSPEGPIPDLWAVGTTVEISFIDGTEAQHKKVVAVAKEWLSYANISFVFRDEPSTVRISFSQQGNWTYPGVTALKVARGGATMNLGSVTSSEATERSERGVILHEFGHMLGLIHEHQNPAADLQWNKDRVYSVFTKPPNSWSIDRINRVMIDPVSVEKYNVYRAFDRDSVMNFNIPAEFFLDGVGITPGTDLSESDRQLVAELYPS